MTKFLVSTLKWHIMAPVIGMREQGSIEVGCVHQLKEIINTHFPVSRFKLKLLILTLYLCLCPGSVPHSVGEVGTFEVRLLCKDVKHSVLHPHVADLTKGRSPLFNNCRPLAPAYNIFSQGDLLLHVVNAALGRPDHAGAEVSE